MENHDLIAAQMNMAFDLAAGRVDPTTAFQERILTPRKAETCFWCDEKITSEDMTNGSFHEEPINFGKETGYWHLPCKASNDQADDIDRIHDEWMDQMMERGDGNQ